MLFQLLLKLHSNELRNQDKANCLSKRVSFAKKIFVILEFFFVGTFIASVHERLIGFGNRRIGSY